jgi:phage terminase small subunit
MAGNMNSGGRPLPREIKELKGTLQECREVSDAPSLPKVAIPDPPEHYSAEDRAVWFEVASCVAILGVYTEADAIAFRMLVETVAVTRRPDTADTARTRAYSTAINLMSRFGMDPASRTRVARASGEAKSQSENAEESADVPLFGQPLKIVGE